MYKNERRVSHGKKKDTYDLPGTVMRYGWYTSALIFFFMIIILLFDIEANAIKYSVYITKIANALVALKAPPLGIILLFFVFFKALEPEAWLMNFCIQSNGDRLPLSS